MLHTDHIFKTCPPSKVIHLSCYFFNHPTNPKSFRCLIRNSSQLPTTQNPQSQKPTAAPTPQATTGYRPPAGQEDALLLDVRLTKHHLLAHSSGASAKKNPSSSWGLAQRLDPKISCIFLCNHPSEDSQLPPSWGDLPHFLSFFSIHPLLQADEGIRCWVAGRGGEEEPHLRESIDMIVVCSCGFLWFHIVSLILAQLAPGTSGGYIMRCWWIQVPQLFT